MPDTTGIENGSGIFLPPVRTDTPNGKFGAMSTLACAPTTETLAYGIITRLTSPAVTLAEAPAALAHGLDRAFKRQINSLDSIPTLTDALVPVAEAFPALSLPLASVVEILAEANLPVADAVHVFTGASDIFAADKDI